jgi:type I restriction enzyme M protein
MADQNLSSFLWSVADVLQGDYKRSDFGKVFLPFTVLRRLDCMLEATKAEVKEKSAPRSRLPSPGRNENNLEKST